MSTPVKVLHRSIVTLALPKSVPAAISRIKGAASAHNDKRKALVAVLQQVRFYVQSVADADQGNGPAIIESAGVAVRKRPTGSAALRYGDPFELSSVRVRPYPP